MTQVVRTNANFFQTAFKRVLNGIPFENGKPLLHVFAWKVTIDSGLSLSSSFTAAIVSGVQIIAIALLASQWFPWVEPEDVMLKQELTLYSTTVYYWSSVLHETVSCTFLVCRNCENSQYHWIYLISYEKLRSFENEMELRARKVTRPSFFGGGTILLWNSLVSPPLLLS